MTDIFDLVNLCDQVVGSSERDKVHKFNLFHRAVHILVFRPNGRLIIQQRSEKKIAIHFYGQVLAPVMLIVVKTIPLQQYENVRKN